MNYFVSNSWKYMWLSAIFLFELVSTDKEMIACTLVIMVAYLLTTS